MTRTPEIPDDPAQFQPNLAASDGSVRHSDAAAAGTDVNGSDRGGSTNAIAPAFAFNEISWSVGETEILRKVSESVPAASVTALIGPNGSGKSSLLRILTGVQRPDSGLLEVSGRDWLKESSKSRARTLAYVEQNANPDRSLSVLDVVLLGRMPHRSLFTGPSAEDSAIARESLELVGLLPLADREFGTLSGGEKQRVLVAKALAQRTDIIVVDEPTNHLDIGAQLSTLSLLHGIAQGGRTVLTALHDLNLAATYCDRVIVMDHGTFVASGPPSEVLTEALIRKVYDVEATIMTNPRTGKPLIAFG